MIANITSPLNIGQSSNYYTLKEAEGFGSGGVEVVKWNRPGFHGAKTPRAFWRERIMRLVIGVRSSTSSDYEARRRALEEAFDFPRNGLTWLKFTTQGGLALQTQVQLNAEIQAPLRGGEVTIGDFRIELIAEDPIFYSQTQTTTDITFASGSGTVTNSGNAPVFPTVRVHGNIQDPSILNSVLGRTVSLSGITISAGHYYDINMIEETIKDETGNNKYNYIDSDDFFWLSKGDNTITLGGTAGGSGSRKVTFSYRNGYLGI
jgi:hypothetical protein